VYYDIDHTGLYSAIGETVMLEILVNMDEEKRARIINSAIDEFAKYPYEKASTNNIVKNAGISKGLLFHYFGSKKDLYEKLVEFVLNTLSDKMTSQIDWEQTDIFERIKQSVICKMKLQKAYPNMINFIYNVIENNNAKSIDEIVSMYEKYGVDVGSIIGKLYSHNIDYSKFSDQTSTDKSINIIRWSLEKYSEEQLHTMKGIKRLDFFKIAAELDAYVDVLKKAFY